jgi:hypothetical protein
MTEPSLRLHHFMGISDGKIELSLAGTPKNADPVAFDDEQAALNALAAAMWETGTTNLLTSSSVNHPEEYGRPRHDQDQFGIRLRKKLKALGEREAEGEVVIAMAKGQTAAVFLIRRKDGDYEMRGEDLKKGGIAFERSGNIEDLRREFIIAAVEIIKADETYA